MYARAARAAVSQQASDPAPASAAASTSATTHTRARSDKPEDPAPAPPVAAAAVSSGPRAAAPSAVPAVATAGSIAPSALPRAHPFAHLIVDANAYIAGAALHGLADRFWTVDSVLSEVRDKNARALMTMLPYTIETRIPAEGSMDAVREFARKTGDLSKLSRTDLQLLALAHQLERQENGATFLRSEPPSAVTRAAMPGRPVTNCKFFGTPGGCRAGAACRFVHDATIAVAEAAKSLDATSSSASASAAAPGADDAGEGEWIVPKPPTATSSGGWDESAAYIPFGNERIPVGTGAVAVDVAAVAEPLVAPTQSSSVAGDPAGHDETGAASFADAADAEGAESEHESDDDAPSVATAPVTGPQRVPVALITSDYAMQNVALQMGLQLATHSGKVVRTVKTWVMKCDACFTITTEMDRLFCPRCGNAALARLGVTLGPDGAPRYHYKKNRQVNVRGTIYALPKPKGGRDGAGKDLLLREDQLLTGSWAQRVKEKAAAAARDTGMFSDRAPTDDWLAASSGSHARVRGNDLRHAGGIADIEVGYGRRNPNARRGRRR